MVVWVFCCFLCFVGFFKGWLPFVLWQGFFVVVGFLVVLGGEGWVFFNSHSFFFFSH